MITPRSFSEHRPFFSRAYFGGLLRRGWPQTVFAVLALFFVLPLPILLQINERGEWHDAQLSELLNMMLGENIWICALVAAGMAVLAGIVATRYLTRRASVDYYHSLPIRREGLLFMQWLAGLTHFAAALAVELGLSLLIFAAKADVITPFADPFAMLMGSAGYMLLSFLLFYSLTVFCGLLCGTSLMQAVLTGLSLAVLPLLRALFFAFAERGWAMVGLEPLGMSLEDIFITVVDKTEEDKPTQTNRYTRNTQKRGKRTRTSLENDLADTLVKDAEQRREDAAEDENVD